MYDHVRGEVTESQPARAVLRTGDGVGYEFKVPVGTSAQLRVGETATLFTILHVVDGQPSLLGFAERRERELARRLLTVSGVGPSMSLAILSSFSPPQVATAIVNGDATLLKSVKGVGAKTAERLCLELRDHVAKMGLGEEAAPGEEAVLLPHPQSEDAVSALLTLGYSEKDARTRVAKVAAAQPDAEPGELIKLVLRG